MTQIFTRLKSEYKPRMQSIKVCPNMKSALDRRKKKHEKKIPLRRTLLTTSNITPPF